MLADLNISEGSPPPGSSKDGVDPLAEPSPMLPLWRRVDKQFWWNEWLSKLFIDAGVCAQFYTDTNGRLTATHCLVAWVHPPRNAGLLPDHLFPRPAYE